MTKMGTRCPWREPKGWSAPVTSSFSMGIGLGSHCAGPVPPQCPSAVLTGGTSASRPHRGHRGPGGWRTAHLGDRRERELRHCLHGLIPLPAGAPLRNREGSSVHLQLRGGSQPAATRAGLIRVHRTRGSWCYCETCRPPSPAALWPPGGVSGPPRGCPVPHTPGLPLHPLHGPKPPTAPLPGRTRYQSPR